MPVILKRKTLLGLEIGIWKITEEESYFTSRLELTDSEQVQLQPIKGQRRVHWLASRYLMHLLTDPSTPRLECIKDEYGKPHLHPFEGDISFSHSDELIAVSMGPNPNGIDIQKEVPKIRRIAYKFVRSDEGDQDQMSIMDLHIIWGAKEAVYKAYGRKRLDFKEHMKCSWNHETRTVRVDLSREREEVYQGKYEKWGPYVLVYLSLMK